MWMWTIFNPLECKVKSGKCWPLIVWSVYELCWLQFVVCWVVPGPLSTSIVSCSCSGTFLNPIKQNLFCSLSPATTISTHTSYPPHIYTTHRAKHKIKIPSSIRCQHSTHTAHSLSPTITAAAHKHMLNSSLGQLSCACRILIRSGPIISIETIVTTGLEINL